MALGTLSKTKRKLKFPTKLDSDGLLLGWSLERTHPKTPMGFSFGHPLQTPDTGFIDPILYEGDGHIMTIAPTGSGKGVGCVIPALLRYPGPVIVIDPKGENVAVTARRRRELGQRVIVLDPMQITGFPSDTLNPLDLIDPTSALAIDDAAAITELTVLDKGEGVTNGRFWVNRASQLIVALIMHLLCDHPPERRTFEQLRRIVNSSPSEFPELAKAMAESANQDVRHAAATLILPAVETLGGYLSHAQEQLEFARGPLVQAATRRSTFSLDAVTSGEPLSIYIVMPPDKLESHGRLLRLWIGVLMSAIIRRRAQPRQSTLLLLDEAAQLGTMPQLRQAISLLRGYGVQTWSFWQDISQLKQLYPGDWETMVNNCKIQQAFGANNLRASRDVAELMGFSDPYKIQDLEHDEMALLISGDEPVIALRPSYLNDSIFAGHFDRNPLYDAGRPIMPPHMPAPEPVPPPLAQAPASKQYTRPPKAQPAVGGSRLAKIPSVDKDALADLKGLWG